MEINLEILIGSLALILSLVSLYHQFFHKEIVVYPGLKNENLYLHIENSGQSLIRDFSIEIINMEDLLATIKMNDYEKKKFKDRDGLNGNSSNTLASKGKRTILLGHFKIFRSAHSDYPSRFPVISVKVRYKGLKRDKIFICDYNSYRNEMVDHDTIAVLKEINNTLKSKNP